MPAQNHVIEKIWGATGVVSVRQNYKWSALRISFLAIPPYSKSLIHCAHIESDLHKIFATQVSFFVRIYLVSFCMNYLASLFCTDLPSSTGQMYPLTGFVGKFTQILPKSLLGESEMTMSARVFQINNLHPFT